ncbi:MAG: peptide-methionine (S)-S-oxide reductase MsrA [Pseudomonadota bacterium]
MIVRALTGLATLVLGVWLTGCGGASSTPAASATIDSKTPQADKTGASLSGERAIAYVAGGCFWCVESDFEKLSGVYEAISGYTGGDVDNPTYKQVTYKQTGHLEAVKIVYDPQTVSYRALIDYHFRHIDPLDDGGQFCDRGHSYKTAIFVANDDERTIAEAAKKAASTVLGQSVVTPILDLKTFWDAEDYHQDYYKKNPLRYKYYRTGCRRDARVKQLWDGK